MTSRGAGVELGIPADTHDLTGLLVAWREGDDEALDRLIPLVEGELHRIAACCMRGEARHHSLQATVLVNEAFLRLVDARKVNWQNRAHFLAMAARLMRRVLVDLARARQADKRGGEALRITLDEDLVQAQSRNQDLVRLDDALHDLAVLDERKSRIVEMRFFAGLSVEEIAAVLNLSTRTVIRDWEFARAWLQRQIRSES